jgi:RNA polymerase sigma factor (sigma-70 family)
MDASFGPDNSQHFTSNSKRFEPMASEEESDGCIRACLRRLRRRPIPPNWSTHDWEQEVYQIAALAIVEVQGDPDEAGAEDLNLVFLSRVSADVRTRHRREWLFGTRLQCMGFPYEAPSTNCAGTDADFLEPTIESKHFHQELREGISNLPEAYLQVISLLFFKGLTEAEVAKMLCLNQSTINRRKRAALSNLRSCLRITIAEPCPRKAK